MSSFGGTGGTGGLRGTPENFEENENGLPNPFDENLDENEAENIEEEADMVIEESETTSVITNARQWYVLLEEDTSFFTRGDSFHAQFTPEQVQRNVGSKIEESGGYSVQSPIIQWLGGILETITLRARVFSHHSEDNSAQEKLDAFESLSVQDRNLGRPPIVSFFWGLMVPDGFPCLIESIGGIEYDKLRDDASLRGASLDITLKRFTQPFLEQLSVEEDQERTPTRIVKHGETYEMIAYQEYGDPMFGVLLRRMNTRSYFDPNAPSSIADLKSGDRIKIFPKKDLIHASIRPQSHILRLGKHSAAARNTIFRKRGRKVGVFPRR